MTQIQGDIAEYLQPPPDRLVDRKLVDFISDWVIDRVAGTLPQAHRILELGVGDQIWTPKLLRRFADVTTVDGSAPLLDAMGQAIAPQPWTPVCSYFEEYVPAERFDGVLATYVMEHVDDPQLIMARAREHWLRPGGWLAIVVPHALSLHRRLGVKLGMIQHPAQLGDTDRRMGHQTVFTCYGLEQMLVAAGLSIVEKQGMFTKLLPNSLLTGCTDAQLKAMFELGMDLPIEYSGAIYYLARAS